MVPIKHTRKKKINSETALKSMNETRDACEREPDLNDRQGRKLQVSLLSLLLLIAACGIWIAYRKAVADIAGLEQQLAGLRRIARELIVEDPKQIAAVKRLPQMYNENIWDVYIPEIQGKHFELRLAMDDVPSTNQRESFQLEPLKQAILMPGKHAIELRYNAKDSQENAVLTVLVNGETVIEEIRPEDWVDSSGSSSSSSVGSKSKSFDIDKPVCLRNTRFTVTQKNGITRAPQEPGPGILLWIEMDSDYSSN